MLHSICQQMWKTQQWPQDWKRSVFIPIPKKGNAKECSNYRTILLISHASKLMLKIHQARLQQYVNCELPDVQAGFRKVRDPETKFPTSAESSKTQGSSIKTFTSALLTIPKPLTMQTTTNWKILQEMGITDHLTCLLRNLCAGQEATVKTGQGTMDWFQIGKGVCQGCILSPCLFNFYAESVSQSSRVRLFGTPWTAALQDSLSITNSQSLLKLMSI